MVDSSGSGNPIKWEDNSLKWIVDGGPLNSAVSNQTALRWVNRLFGVWRDAELDSEKWGSLPVINLEMQYSGTLAYDINLSNYYNVAILFQPKAVIIFDAIGEIIDSELGEGAKNYVVGFASPFSNGSGYLSGGVVVLNGLFVDGDRNNSGELYEEEFKAAILHEIGHLLNLDHTQANIEAAERIDGYDFSLTDEIPTMYPVLYSEDQLNLHADDKIALAEQYPSDYYASYFCKIAGELKDADGLPMQGVDVVARATDPVFEWSDVRSYVSGVAYPMGTANGEYVLGGVVPGRGYNVGYRGIDPLFTGGSSIAPFDPPISAIVAGTINSNAVACATGGESENVALNASDETVQIDSAKDISEEGAPVSSTDDSSNSTGGAQPAGGCSLIP